jgi:hypothetical protein
MELKDFIKETIVAIAEGAREANEEIKKNGGMVNPCGYILLNGVPHITKGSDHKKESYPIISVEFKAKIEVAESSDKAVGGNLKVITASSVGAKHEQCVQEVCFSLPVALRTQKHTVPSPPQDQLR